MQGSRIKVGPVWPHDGMNLGVKPYLIEKPLILQRAIHRSGQHWQEIDFSHHAVGECEPQTIRPNDLQARDAMKSLSHTGT